VVAEEVDSSPDPVIISGSDVVEICQNIELKKHSKAFLK